MYRCNYWLWQTRKMRGIREEIPLSSGEEKKPANKPVEKIERNSQLSMPPSAIFYEPLVSASKSATGANKDTLKHAYQSSNMSKNQLKIFFLFDTPGINDQKAAAFAPNIFNTGHANLIFFNACSSRLKSPPSGFFFQCLKYVYIVPLGGKSFGIMSHWQPLFNTYNTAQNTSYKSTLRGLVFLRALSSRSSIFGNCSRLVSLGQAFLISQVQPISINLTKISKRL